MAIFNQKLFVSRILQKIISNRVSNVSLALDLWKAMPLRMRWRLRQKALRMSDVINKLSQERLSRCQTVFKQYVIEGKQMKKRGVYLMASKFETILRKYFQRYHRQAIALKKENQMEMVGKIFENIRAKAKENMGVMMEAPAEWPRKARKLNLLNDYLRKRLANFMQVWQKNANAISYCNKIVDEKKIRVLENLNQLLLKEDVHKTRKIIEILDKNRRIHNLQVNFLKKLCEGQAGKLLKSFMIWKSMPEVKNKERIMNATTFATNLSQLLKKNLKETLSVFQGFRKEGMEKRYQGVNRLVASKCS